MLNIKIENTKAKMHLDIKNGKIYLDLQSESEFESASYNAKEYQNVTKEGY